MPTDWDKDSWLAFQLDNSQECRKRHKERNCAFRLTDNTSELLRGYCAATDQPQVHFVERAILTAVADELAQMSPEDRQRVFSWSARVLLLDHLPADMRELIRLGIEARQRSAAKRKKAGATERPESKKKTRKTARKRK